MKISVIGPPGCGKTTQAKMLAEKISLPHVYMGGLLWKAIAEKTELGRQVEEVVKKGGLVDDDLVLELFFARIDQKDCRQGFVADGVPRTLYQAEQIEERFHFDKVFFIDVSLPVVKERLLGRKRADDTEKAIGVRFGVYLPEVRPILAFFRERGRLIEVDGERSIEDIATDIFRRISSVD